MQDLFRHKVHEFVWSASRLLSMELFRERSENIPSCVVFATALTLKDIRTYNCLFHGVETTQRLSRKASYAAQCSWRFLFRLWKLLDVVMSRAHGLVGICIYFTAALDYEGISTSILSWACMFGVICGNYESWEAMFFHCGEGLRAGIFGCVGFTFSPSTPGYQLCFSVCVGFVLVLFLWLFYLVPWSFRLLHCLFNKQEIFWPTMGASRSKKNKPLNPQNKTQTSHSHEDLRASRPHPRPTCRTSPQEPTRHQAERLRWQQVSQEQGGARGQRSDKVEQNTPSNNLGWVGFVRRKVGDHLELVAKMAYGRKRDQTFTWTSLHPSSKPILPTDGYNLRPVRTLIHSFVWSTAW